MPIQRPKPIVDQVAAELRQRIHDRVYPPGERLPSETEFAQELGVSRTTVRTVLAKFANEGLILRKQGDGTYVNERIGNMDKHYGGIRDFSKLIEANGYQPSIQTLLLQHRPATLEESHQLEIDVGGEVVAIDRLFSADDRPVIYATNVFRKSFVKVDVDSLDGNLSIHEILQTYCHAQIAYVISDIEATLVDENLAMTLYQAVGKPMLKLKETFYSKTHQPLTLGVSFYDFTALKLRLVHGWR